MWILWLLVTLKIHKIGEFCQLLPFFMIRYVEIVTNLLFGRMYKILKKELWNLGL